ncbi:MAG: sn-glycerol-3-phosphate import ATP-binding protein UgpC [Alcaligenaceae bacterium]|nr:sn-glycerol-3-phosphate import ATP-binding protein UgpC [Alcaligenaceae bacterium]
MSNIIFNNVKKTYANKVQVIHGLNMTVHPGEFIVIVGPSGCGKSTLMRMVAGLETITEGTIQINDQIVNDLEPAERNIAMVFQNYALYPHMNVYNNMAYGLKMRKIPKEEIDRRVREAAEILELTHLLKRRPKALSGGQRQRVAMGRAIVRHPQVFLFDEPLSNLDAKLRVQMRLEIQKLHKRLKTTSLYVTHDQIEAMTLAQRMIVMNKGNVEQIGTPDEVFKEPASTFVASFIGAPPMNLINVHIDDHKQVKTSEGIALNIPENEIPSSIIGKDAILGIRPEHIATTGTGFKATVDMIEVLGTEQLIYMKLGTQSVILRTFSDKQDTFSIGQEVSFGTTEDHPIHWFDADTTKRITR